MSLQKLGNFIEEYSKKNKTNEPYPVYSVTNSNGFCTEYFNKDVSGQNKKAYKIVPKGYFAYNPSRINVGSIDWQNCEDNVIVSPLYVVFKCTDNLEQDYLKYFLKSSEGIRLINTKVSGSIRNSLKFAALSELEFNIVDIDKQREIVSKLKYIEDAIDNEKKQIELYDELVKARFVEMFGDPVTNPMGWEKARLADMCDIVTGNTPSRKVKEYYGDAIEWIKSDNITEATTLTTAVEYLSEKGKEVGRIVDGGSILMTCIAGSLHSIGNVAIADRKVAFNQQINAIVPNEQNTYFMYEQFRMSKDYICSGVNMALKGILSKGQLSEIEFIFPPIALQKQFADFVAQVNKSKVAARKRLELYGELLEKKTYDYFVG